MDFKCPIPLQDYEAITMGHGGGGRLTQRLIEQLFVPGLDNPFLSELGDGAVLPWSGEHVAMSTDSYVIRPPFFPGGDIGLLAVHGTTNDLAMCGARPRFLSLSFILEEGFLLKDLWRVIASIRTACESLQIHVVTGDTKVVERGRGDGIFINTTGIGEMVEGIRLSPASVREGDRILLSGPIAEHGMAIMSVRENFEFETPLQSDTAALWPVVEEMLTAAPRAIHCLRDATRGGVASVVNEIAQASKVGILLDESSIAVKDPVRAYCEILGLDPLYVANEGRFLCFAAPDAADRLLEILSAHPLGEGSAIIGEVVTAHPGVVRMKTALGASRVVDMISGEQLPRIC